MGVARRNLKKNVPLDFILKYARTDGHSDTLRLVAIFEKDNKSNQLLLIIFLLV